MDGAVCTEPVRCYNLRGRGAKGVTKRESARLSCGVRKQKSHLVHKVPLVGGTQEETHVTPAKPDRRTGERTGLFSSLLCRNRSDYKPVRDGRKRAHKEQVRQGSLNRQRKKHDTVLSVEGRAGTATAIHEKKNGKGWHGPLPAGLCLPAGSTEIAGSFTILRFYVR